jgi:acyl-CoA thioester hydrolase
MISASVNETIQFYHLDPMNVVWHGNYPQFFEVARCALLDKISYNYQQMEQSGYLWPVVDMRIKYLRPCLMGQKITITARLSEYENRLKIDYLICDSQSGSKLTKDMTIQVAVEKSTGEMLYRSPDCMIALVEAQL